MQVGDRFALLVLIEKTAQRHRNNIVGRWQCDCGRQKLSPLANVKAGMVKSCGCLKTTHGATRSDEYRAWSAMKARCSAEAGRDYDAYAARGIGICDRWSDFSAFLADLGPKPSKAHSLGRIDNDLGYAPGNCRWETPAEQMQNTRKSMTWVIKGVSFKTCRAAAAHFGIDHKTIRYWVRTRGDCHAIPKY